MPIAIPEATQRELQGDLRAVENELRRVIDRACRERGGDQRERRSILRSQLEIVIASVEDVIYDSPEADEGQSKRLRALYHKTDQLMMTRAQLDRDRRLLRRQRDDVALDRRERDLDLLEAEYELVADPADE